jgi:hypothetical protein
MAKAAVVAVKAVPAKRAAPDMSGVPGTLVSLDGLDIDFAKWNRASPYDALLEKLVNAPPNSALLFANGLRARASICARAKKKGLIVGLAEKGPDLYVKFIGRVEDNEKESRRKKIKQLLRLGPLNCIQIATKLREGGDGVVDAQLVDTILAQMQKAGDVIRQEGGNCRLVPGAK